MRQRALWERPVNYGAVGASAAGDLLTYPPAGFRPVERRVRIGFGDARWEYAWMQTLSWGIQRASGFRVELVESPAEVTDLTYRPVGFDEAGNPVTPASSDTGGDALFGPDGTAFLQPGDVAILATGIRPLQLRAPVRVVYVVDEPLRKGFAYGTLVGHPISGEESWIVDRTEDGSVWMTIRSLSRPASWYGWLGYPVLRIAQAITRRRYERALAGPIPEVPGAYDE